MGGLHPDTEGTPACRAFGPGAGSGVSDWHTQIRGCEQGYRPNGGQPCDRPCRCRASRRLELAPRESGSLVPTYPAPKGDNQCGFTTIATVKEVAVALRKSSADALPLKSYEQCCPRAGGLHQF